METDQPGFVRTNTGKILRADSPQAQALLASKQAGPTATFGVVRFLTKWTSPAGKEYQPGDFEKFATTDAASAALLTQLQDQGIVRPV
jgi:hypothetical protein